MDYITTLCEAGKDVVVVLCFGARTDARKLVLDFPTWPVHPSYHAPHCVPPQDGDAQVLAGTSVLKDLVVVSSLPDKGQPIVQCLQILPQAWIGDDNNPRPFGFACSVQVCVADAVFYPLVTQE